MRQISGKSLNLNGRYVAALIGGLAGILVFLAITWLSPAPQTQYLMNSNLSIDKIEDNNVGTLIVRSRSSLPGSYREPNLASCIYTGVGKAPFIAPVKTGEIRLLGAGEFRKLDINISIPEEQFTRDLEGGFKAVKKDSCPLRMENKTVVVVEK